jgi:hypothetical protein
MRNETLQYAIALSLSLGFIAAYLQLQCEPELGISCSFCSLPPHQQRHFPEVQTAPRKLRLFVTLPLSCESWKDICEEIAFPPSLLLLLVLK